MTRIVIRLSLLTATTDEKRAIVVNKKLMLESWFRVRFGSLGGVLVRGAVTLAVVVLLSAFLPACGGNVGAPKDAEPVGRVLATPVGDPPWGPLGGPPRYGPPRGAWHLDGLVARSPEISLSVHQVVVSPDFMTVLYSVELVVPPGQVADFLPTAKLISSADSGVAGLVMSKTFSRADGVSLGALTFGLDDMSGRYVTLLVDDLLVKSFSDGSTRRMVGPWQIPLVTKRSPGLVVSGFGYRNFEGRRYSDKGSVELKIQPVAHIETPSMGRVALGAYEVDGNAVFLLFKPDGNVIEITEEWFSVFDPD